MRVEGRLLSPLESYVGASTTSTGGLRISIDARALFFKEPSPPPSVRESRGTSGGLSFAEHYICEEKHESLPDLPADRVGIARTTFLAELVALGSCEKVPLL